MFFLKRKFLPNRLFAGITIFLTSVMSAQAMETAEQDLCDASGYTVVFFNGVGNTVRDARAGLLALEQRLGIGDTYNGERVAYEAFINTTGSEDQSPLSTLQDVLEVVQQTPGETNRFSEDRFNLFLDSLGDKNSYSLLEIALGALTGSSRERYLEYLGSLGRSYRQRLQATISSWISTPPTASDYVRQHTRIRSLALEGQKLLLIAHSQGNLFVNQAYDAALEIDNFTANNIGVVHIAPASSTLRGPHILATQDRIINTALGSIAGVPLPESNFELPDSHLSNVDASGHLLVDTYLNADLGTLQFVQRLAQETLGNIQEPRTEGSEGFFTATLTWNGSGDVDLHIEEPDRTHVFWSNKQGNSGRLDVDNTFANGPEHYFASCNPVELQEGVYRFGINNFAGADGRRFALQLSSAREGVLVTHSNIDVGPALGSEFDSDPFYLYSVIVMQDSDGNFSVSAL